MSAAGPGLLRVGLDLGPGPATAVLVDEDDRIVARCGPTEDPGDGVGSDPEDAAATVRRLLAAVLPPGSGPVRAVVSCVGPADGLGVPEALDRVGVLRIGAPATTAVPPLTGWPDDLAAAVRGPVRVVRGGHLHDGAEIAPLDVEAVLAFGELCGSAGVAAVSVAAAASHLDPSHEQRAAALLGAVLGPGVPVVTADGYGGVGLLERENTAIFDAALAGRAGALTAALSAALVGAAGPDAELYLMSGGGHVMSPERAALHPLQLVGAPYATARAGTSRLTGRATLVVVEGRPDGVRIGGLVDGLVPSTGTFREVRGVRLAIRTDRVVHLYPQHRDAGTQAERVRAGIERVAAAPGAAPVAVAGRVGSAGLPPAVLTPPEREVAAAYGAATAEASATVDLLFRFADGSLAEGMRMARRAARDGAVRAGADPRRVRVGPVREMAMTYVPMPCVRLGVTATGPLVAPARPDPGGDRW